MARHPKHRSRKKNTQIYQESPFLNLPGEIRMQIYRVALIRSTPIDLWPRAYIENPEDNPLLAPRIAKARDKFHGEHRDNGDAHIPTFRRQDDLQFVRKEMAVGLLATCKQIYNEAANLFWRDNTFRFSSDMEWFGVRRSLVQSDHEHFPRSSCWKSLYHWRNPTASIQAPSMGRIVRRESSFMPTSETQKMSRKCTWLRQARNNGLALPGT